jgi:hypothetical protein
MSEIDPLIKREMQWMALGVLENRDLAPVIITRVRRQRARRALMSVVAALAISGLSISAYEFINRPAADMVLPDVVLPDVVLPGTGVTGDSAVTKPEIVGLQSDYPVTWEQSVGDVDAISGAGGIGDTLGGLTAVGLKISWERCGEGLCPITWVLNLKNNTQDLISTSPSLGIFTSNTPLVSDSRPTTVLPGGTALLVYNFPEFKASLPTSARDTWQWNWYLAQLR